MRLDYLRYFDHLAEVLNYTRAAEDLFIAQPTLSVAIKRMEKELGIKLFQRSEGSTRIELTEMGKAYHEYVALALKRSMPCRGVFGPRLLSLLSLLRR